MPFIKVGLVN